MVMGGLPSELKEHGITFKPIARSPTRSLMAPSCWISSKLFLEASTAWTPYSKQHTLSFWLHA
jgi:hypothetical protein